MANTKSAKKTAKQAEVKRKRNVARKTAIKSAVKKVLTALEQGQDAETIKALFNEAQAKFARAKNKGLVHANTAARKMSRLSKKIATKTKG